MRFIELRLQRGGVRAQFRDRCLQGVERVLVLELHPFFFFNDTATTEIYTLSLHELFRSGRARRQVAARGRRRRHADPRVPDRARPDRKSTRLNSSHVKNSYAVFCLKKKKKRSNEEGDKDKNINNGT